MGHVTEQSAMITQLILAMAAFANMILVGSLGLEHNVKLNWNIWSQALDKDWCYKV